MISSAGNRNVKCRSFIGGIKVQLSQFGLFSAQESKLAPNGCSASQEIQTEETIFD